MFGTAMAAWALYAVLGFSHKWEALFVGISLPLTYCAVALIRRYAVRWRLLDVPNHRSSHAEPMPLGGGLALVVISGLGLIVYESLQPIISWQHVIAFLGGAALIAAVSLVDDLSYVPYTLRLLVQTGGASIFMAGVSYWHLVTVPVFGTLTLGSAGVALTLVWIVGLTNAFNFMDGSDGLAAGQAVVAAFGWFVLGLVTGQHVLVVIGALLATTSLGFLLHNWHPASIFMGDVGSTFLGYSFAAVTVIGSRSDPKLVVAGILLVWPAIFDSLFTVVCRLRRGENIFVGHREFLFHRLMRVGWKPRAVAALYMALPLLGALLAFSWDRGTRPLHLAVVLALGALCGALWLLVRQQERRRAGPQLPPVDAESVLEEAAAIR